jgi:hypothetical protein
MDRALDAFEGDAIRAHYDALLLGNLREDVYKFPFLRMFMLGKGLTHYYRPGGWWGVFPLVPSAPTRSNWLFDRGVRFYRSGQPAHGVFCLGRAVHLLSEMAAPVHAQMVLHWRGDPFEMYLERNARTLRKLPIADLPDEAKRAQTAGELVHQLAVYCQSFPCDRTNNVPGWLGAKLGIFRPHDQAEVERQVNALVPMGAAYTLALYRLFMERARS